MSEPLPEDAWPINEVNMGSDKHARLRAAHTSSGVIGDPGGPQLQPYTTASGLFVRAGTALICGVFYELLEDKQIAVPQNVGGTSRVDLLSLRFDLSSSPKPELVLTPGTPGAPVPGTDPADVFDVPISFPVLPSGAVVPSTAPDARRFAGLDVVPCRVVADIPPALRRFGMHAVESAAGDRVRVWNGTSWRTLRYVDDVDPAVTYTSSELTQLNRRHGVGTLQPVPGQSQGTPTWTVENDGVRVTESGFYAVDANAGLGAAVTGRTFFEIAKGPNGATVVKRSSTNVGEDAGGVGHSGFYVAKGDKITIATFQNTGDERTLAWLVTIRRVRG